MTEKPVQLYHFGREACKRGHTYGPAVRDHYLIHCVLRGKGTYHVGEKTYPLQGGQAFLILPGVVTTYSADDTDPWEYVWIGFQGADVPYILELLHTDLGHPILSFSDGDGLQRIIDACESSYTPAAPLAAISYVYAFLSKLQPAAAPTEQSAADAVLEAALAYLKRNFSYDGVTIAQLARYIGISRSQLYRIFMQKLGIPPKTCLVQIRLHNASRLLLTTDLTVTEVMYSCGYSDPANFSRQFKQAFGCSPRRHRTQRTQ